MENSLNRIDIPDIRKGLSSIQWAIMVLAAVIVAAVCYLAENLEPWIVAVTVPGVGVVALILLFCSGGRSTITHEANQSLPNHPLTGGLPNDWDTKYSTLRSLRTMLDSLWVAQCSAAGATAEAELVTRIWACCSDCSIIAIARVLEIVTEEHKLRFVVFLGGHRDAWPFMKYAKEFHDVFTQHLPVDASCKLYRAIDDLRLIVRPYIQNNV